MVIKTRELIDNEHNINTQNIRASYHEKKEISHEEYHSQLNAENERYEAELIAEGYGKPLEPPLVFEPPAGTGISERVGYIEQYLKELQRR